MKNVIFVFFETGNSFYIASKIDGALTDTFVVKISQNNVYFCKSYIVLSHLNI